MKTKIILFDWGNTIMVDFAFPGPMYTWEKVAWVPGAEKMLQTISLKYKCCIATNAGASTIQEVLLALTRVGADKYFSEIFPAIEIGYEKPDERFFSAIIHKLGVSPADCVMIGDNYEKDCVGAKQAGLKTVFYNANKITGSFPLADAVIRSFEDLIKIIEKL